jgi:predicted transport protein
MSDLKLFRTSGDTVVALPGSGVALERSLQALIEKNMETMFGVRFLASEHSTGVKHGGRIDSLGLDENGSPVIFEYKRATNENVINQGLFYLDWLVDHKAEFQLLVQNKFGAPVADTLDWTAPRLVCVAGDFTKYDAYAVLQIGRAIELVKYTRFGEDLISLDLIASSHVVSSPSQEIATPKSTGKKTAYKTVTEVLDQAPTPLSDLYGELEAFLLALGDDVTKNTLKDSFAFRRLKNFACVEIHPQTKNLLIYLKVDPDKVDLIDGFSRDVRTIGHFGTGELELRVVTRDDLAKAQPLIQLSYENG